MIPKKIQIIDVTIPKGGFQINHSFLPEQVADIALGLDRSNLPFMDISHGCGVGSFKQGKGGLHSEKVYLKALAKHSLKTKFSLTFNTGENSSLELESLKDHFHLGRVAVYFSEVPKSKMLLGNLADLKKNPITILKGVSELSKAQLMECANQLKDFGTKALILEDTYGDLEEESWLNLLHEGKLQETLPLGFSANQNLGLALRLAILGVENGIEWLDASLLGFGRGGGSVPLEILVSLLQQFGRCEEVDLVELTRTAKNYALPAIRSLPYPRYLDFVLAKHRMDSSTAELFPQISALLEIPLETLVEDLKRSVPNQEHFQQEILENYLAGHKLDFGVVKKFLESGKIPKA